MPQVTTRELRSIGGDMEVHVIKRCFAQRRFAFALLDLLGDLGLLFCGLDGNGSG